MPGDNDKLIEALNLKNIPEEELQGILKKVDERLNSVLLSVLVENLSEEDALKIQDALKGVGDMEEAVAEACARIPGLAEKIERGISEEILRLREVLKSTD